MAILWSGLREGDPGLGIEATTSPRRLGATLLVPRWATAQPQRDGFTFGTRALSPAFDLTRRPSSQCSKARR